MVTKEIKIGIIGLGYVGLPLAHALAEKYEVIGYDISSSRVEELKKGKDRTDELTEAQLKAVLRPSITSNEPGLFVTTDQKFLATCNFYIVTVPTPTDRYNRPIIRPLIEASKCVGSVLKQNDIVVYESTVYPGLTEEECVPILEGTSNLKFNKDFFVGYSPERINPGDKEHTVTKILKIVSGSTKEAANLIKGVYDSIIIAGTYLAPSIRVAEAAKVIENTQRDINIAFVNELAKIFNKLELDTNEVLKAASTKWNFLNFKPGLVGGHCIGVDPYYLAQKSLEVGYNPEIILAGRRINDSMGKFIADEAIKKMISKGIQIRDSKGLILGFTFKENCPDYRNTKVIDIYHELIDFGVNVDVVDPLTDPISVLEDYNVSIRSDIQNLENYDVIILAVGHEEFKNIPLKTSNKRVLYDVKSILNKEESDGRL